MSKVTRRHAKAWLSPIREAFRQMMTGDVDSIRGYPVTRLHNRDDYVRLDYCCAGFSALARRLFPGMDVSALDRVERKLAAGTPMTLDDLTTCMGLFNRMENALVGMSRRVVTDAVLTEQVLIEVENLGLQEAA